MNALAGLSALALQHLSLAQRRAVASRVTDELRPWQGGFDRELLVRAAAAHPDRQYYQVRQGTLYRVSRDDAPGKAWLEAIRQEFEASIGRFLRLGQRAGFGPWPDLDWVINLGDMPTKGAPIWATWVRAKDCALRWPSSAHWECDPAVPLGPTQVRAHRIFTDEALARPWAQRRNIVGWRGTGTGMYDSTLTKARWLSRIGVPFGRRINRLRMMQRVAGYPDRFDAAFTGWPQVSESWGRWLSARYRTAPWVEQAWFPQQRFILNVDGNVGTWSFLTMLGTGSVVLRQDSPYQEFCFPALKSGEHFVPIARDFANLAETAGTCLAAENDAAMQRIAASAQTFARDWLAGGVVDAYQLSLLAGYVELLPRAGSPLLPRAVPVGEVSR